MIKDLWSGQFAPENHFCYNRIPYKRFLLNREDHRNQGLQDPTGTLSRAFMQRHGLPHGWAFFRPGRFPRHILGTLARCAYHSCSGGTVEVRGIAVSGISSGGDVAETNTGRETQPTVLDTGLLPVEELATLARREGRRPLPIYQAHRWFARRFGSAFRALLVAAATPAGCDFWQAYYAGVDWSDRTLLDPFVGGGTSVIEAMQLGANVIGVDVDAVACAITRFETRMAQTPDLRPVLQDLKRHVGDRLAPFYRTVTPDGEPRVVLHYFWVQVVECRQCGLPVEAHPHYQLAHEAEGARQWVFCPKCHQVETLNLAETEVCCGRCAIRVPIRPGPVIYGRLTCPHCGAKERLIDIAARTGQPPRWTLFALETLEAPEGSKRVPLSQRQFRPATEYDRAVLAAVEQALRAQRRPDGTIPRVPDRAIPTEARADDRLPAYGYRYYHELFHTRQLLHLSLLAEAIAELAEPVREAMAMAFSDHLTTNCVMTHYAFGWRRLQPLFSVRAYRHVPRPVEVNPWLDGIGRGTFPNAVHQVRRAIEWAQAPKQALVEGGFSAPKRLNDQQPVASIVNANAQRLAFLADGSIDFVLTDPPYLDNIAYSELSDFFLPWLQQFGLVNDERLDSLRENLAARSRDDADLIAFQRSLRRCCAEIARVLKPEGRLVFTFQHVTAGAWWALAAALAGLRLRPVQLLPLLGDSQAGLHKHQGSSQWDAVFVLVKAPPLEIGNDLALSPGAHRKAREHCVAWSRRLARNRSLAFNQADRRNFYRACLIAAALGLFSESNKTGRRTPLVELLEEEPPSC